MTTALIAAAVLVWAIPVGALLGAYAAEMYMRRDDAEWVTGWLDEETETFGSDTPIFDQVALGQLRRDLQDWGRDG